LGEKLKTLAKGKLLGSEIEIELNRPPSQGCDEQIHLQSETLRFEIDKKDYIQYALTILFAEENLRTLKKLK
jgi:hypothetical protein